MTDATFADKVIAACEAKQSRLVVGLDPHWDMIPMAFKEAHGSDLVSVLTHFLIGVVDATHHQAVAFKPQIAFFEQFGTVGIQVLTQVLARIRALNGLIIMDAKRGDIGSTATAYAQAFFSNPAEPAGDWRSDALTVNGYLGSDGILPFLNQREHGIFVLVKTSNPSSGELQDLCLADGSTVAQHMARSVHRWNAATLGSRGYGNVGAVIGATYPDHMRLLRHELPQSLILVPGYGAQGGSESAISAAFNPDGFGALINSSRGIMFPKELTSSGFAAVTAEAERARVHIQSLIPK